jgi:hypothetical protein
MHCVVTLENPGSFAMFSVPELIAIIQKPGVSSVVFDQCMYGSREPRTRQLYKQTDQVCWMSSTLWALVVIHRTRIGILKVMLLLMLSP